ncbi:MAG: hypothetical protein EBS06_02085 [Proteobacteria bacterium]|nr:hypothetical protein [Pseudomonadota bacterium]
MKKLFLLCLILLPVKLLAQEDLSQGIWKEIVQEEIKTNQAQAKFFDPSFSGNFVTDLNYDRNYQSDNSNHRYNDALLKGIFASKLQINQNFSVKSLLRLEELSKYNSNFAASAFGGNAISSSGNNRFFQNEALRAEEITANYNNKNITILAGKFTPNFGTNWQWGRGIWSNNLSYNYKPTQKVGAGLSYKLGSRKKTGQYNFGFATFTNDRTALNNSLINQTAPYNRVNNAGDAAGLGQSYNGSLDVLFDFAEGEKLSYHFSYINLGVNSNASTVTPSKVADQKGYAAAMNYRYPISDNFLLDGLLEYVRIKNLSGNSDVGEQYSSASLVGEIYRNWNITAATTNLAHQQLNYNGFDQNLSEISLGYKFDKTNFFDQLLLQVGYKSFRTNYKTSIETNSGIGALLRYSKAF